ncbi:hypothetical protein EI94DRAFT_1829987 [Lactarius quietus]|nr:hypothetical protein EI94DRAFT_1829987 [Lactarius quietus]
MSCLLMALSMRPVTSKHSLSDEMAQPYGQHSFAFSVISGKGVFLPETAIFPGAVVLLQVTVFLDISLQLGFDSSAPQEAKDVSAAQEGPIDIFERIKNFSNARRAISRYLKKLVGKIDIEGALRRLDKSTQAEDWMATAQLLKITNGVDDKVNGVAIRSNCCSMTEKQQK